MHVKGNVYIYTTWEIFLLNFTHVEADVVASEVFEKVRGHFDLVPRLEVRLGHHSHLANKKYDEPLIQSVGQSVSWLLLAEG